MIVNVRFAKGALRELRKKFSLSLMKNHSQRVSNDDKKVIARRQHTTNERENFILVFFWRSHGEPPVTVD